MIKLYYAAHTCALATHIVLEDAGAAYTARRISFAKNEQQFGVGIDVAFVRAVLQVFGLDVVPQFFNDLGTGHCLAADHGC